MTLNLKLSSIPNACIPKYASIKFIKKSMKAIQ